MSDNESEYHNSARPYECPGCGLAMRTRGIDGYCVSCIQPDIRCCGYERASGSHVRCDRLIRPGGGHGGTVEGRCATCMEEESRQRRVRDVRLHRQVQRRYSQRHGVAEMTEQDWDRYGG